MSGIAQEEHPMNGPGACKAWKVWEVRRKSAKGGGDLVRACSGEGAIDLVVRLYAGVERDTLPPDATCGPLGCAPSDLRATRVPWLEGYRDLFGPDAVMAKLRHGREVHLRDSTGADGLVHVAESPGGALFSLPVIEEYACHDCYGREVVFMMIALALGATYPDRYSPGDFGEVAA